MVELYETLDFKSIKLCKKPKSNSYKIYQRTLDVFSALFILIIGIPLMLIFGIALVIETPGPVFYTQERVGKMDKTFKLYKLRSMVNDAEKNGAQWAEKDDERVSKVGKIMRKTRIDELPQLFNVLKGDMSIIGPRPERAVFYAQFNKEIPGFIDRLQVKPGLTGWAQVNGGYELSPKGKLRLDMHYIKNRSIKMDMIILLKTVKVVLTGEGAR